MAVIAFSWPPIVTVDQVLFFVLFRCLLLRSCDRHAQLHCTRPCAWLRITTKHRKVRHCDLQRAVTMSHFLKAASPKKAKVTA